MGKNQELDLPRDRMKKVVIAVDVDGTLRCNCTPTCQDPNGNIVSMTNAFVSMKNTQVYVWSGGGKQYAQRFVDLYFVPKVAAKIRAASKFENIRPNIAVDDIQDTALGDINLIVKEK